MIKNSVFKKSSILLGLFTLTLGAFLTLAQPVQAAVRCEIQYGGREVCVKTGQLQINKKVWDPAQKALVDNSDHRFAPGDTVEFTIEVKNVGDTTFSSVKLTDVLPSFLTLASGSVNEEIKDLTVGETETRKITAKVKPASELSKDMVSCDVNVAEAVSGDDRDKDTTRVCWAKPLLKVLPKAGAGDAISPLLLASLTTGLIGICLIQKGKKDAYTRK